ncbi:MAG: response regulator [Campylobacterota bacterium]|nr:response regulator [Campylobacterota bacterium]
MSLKYLGSKNILIVEDDAFNIQLIRSILTKVSDMYLISSHDGAGALSILEYDEVKIDMILLDIRMPIMNGQDLLVHIRQNRKFDDIPVLIISVDERNESELLSIGANDFILKPFDIDDLTAKISTNFDKKIK